LSAWRINEPVTWNVCSCLTAPVVPDVSALPVVPVAPVVPATPLWAVLVAGTEDAAPGVLSAGVVVPVVAGWLCASAGTESAADSASSTQIIFLMAIANAFCFIFPPHLLVRSHLLCEERSCEHLRSIYGANALYSVVGCPRTSSCKARSARPRGRGTSFCTGQFIALYRIAQ
jgi:hypothetical protein